MRRWRLSILFVGSLYLLFISFKFNKFLEIAIQLSGDDTFTGPNKLSVDPVHKNTIHHRMLEDAHLVNILSIIPIWQNYKTTQNSNSNSSELENLADEAWVLGQKAWLEIEQSDLKVSDLNSELHNLGKISSPNCPSDVSVTGTNIGTDQVTVTGTSIGTDRVIFLPCGLAVGSSLTLIGNPHKAHEEYVLHENGKDKILVSQFAFELQGLRDGEDPPKILHFNPRIKGDWSKRPVIEHNTCYRVQWATSLRCDGSPSLDDDDKVDGFIKCEKWNQDNNNDSTDSEESESTSWLKRFMGRAKKPKVTRPFPFVEGRMFVLTIQAGVHGYHIFVGGHHVSSFPYRPGFTLEDARRLAIKGDVDMYSAYATELPSTHPSFFFKKVIEMSEKYRAPILQKGPVFLFIGILSVSNHFAERMAVRKTWMQSKEIENSQVVTRFFVALNQRKEINEVLKKEAEYFGDIVILPLIDRYELIVLKTIAICDYGVKNISAAYVMKCDDDTFVRVNAIIGIIKLISSERPLYLGNLNLLHRPFRSGKWAVTYEEWPEDIYPPFANGPGYIISRDIAQFIVSDYTNRTLRLFKLEDVSMGIWVKKLNSTCPVLYSHSWEFCQYGCVENYFTAHYQSPRQMLCLWDKLSSGSADCCDFR